MTELAASGILLFLISAGVLVMGIMVGEMPFNYKALDTKRETAPITFWAFAAWWTILAVLGILIAVRHWGSAG